MTPTEPTPKVIVNPYWLRWTRLTAGLKQIEIAQQLGVSKSYISNLECGLTVCSARALAAYERLEVLHGST